MNQGVRKAEAVPAATTTRRTTTTTRTATMRTMTQNMRQPPTFYGYHDYDIHVPVQSQSRGHYHHHHHGNSSSTMGGDRAQHRHTYHCIQSHQRQQQQQQQQLQNHHYPQSRRNSASSSYSRRPSGQSPLVQRQYVHNGSMTMVIPATTRQGENRSMSKRMSMPKIRPQMENYHCYNNSTEMRDCHHQERARALKERQSCSYRKAPIHSKSREQDIVFTMMANQRRNSIKQKTTANAPSSSSCPQVKTIEIVPGVEMMLRGAEETLKAIENDFIVSCQCCTCTETIFCIRDAEYALCPTCRVVNPIDIEKTGTEHRVGGVGLGVTASDVAYQQQRQQRVVRPGAGEKKTSTRASQHF